MDMFVVKSELGYARFLVEGQIQWGNLSKASVYSSEEECRALVSKIKDTTPSVRMAKLKIKEEDYI